MLGLAEVLDLASTNGMTMLTSLNFSILACKMELICVPDSLVLAWGLSEVRCQL